MQGIERKQTVDLTADAAPHTYTIPFSEAFTKMAFQLTDVGGGDTFDLLGSIDGTNYVRVGELVGGTINLLTGPGFLFYTKDIPLSLQVSYTVAVPGPGVTPRLHIVKTASTYDLREF